jgi:hypothetical protein
MCMMMITLGSFLRLARRNENPGVPFHRSSGIDGTRRVWCDTETETVIGYWSTRKLRVLGTD